MRVEKYPRRGTSTHEVKRTRDDTDAKKTKERERDAHKHTKKERKKEKGVRSRNHLVGWRVRNVKFSSCHMLFDFRICTK